MSRPHNSLPRPIDYFSYEKASPTLTMGLLPLNLKNWIEIDRNLSNELSEKRFLLLTRHEDVFATLSEAMPGACEVLTLLTEHLTKRFPQIYKATDRKLHNLVTDEFWSFPSEPMHPLELAGRLIQEDLCLLGWNAHKRNYILTGASVCFPTRWVLAEKLGQSLERIHHPVPGYEDQLADKVIKFFDRLKVGRPAWRLNWSLMNDPALFQPRGHGRLERDTTITTQNAGEKLWIRIERQTLRRLPRTRDILFGIRVYVYPLKTLATRPERAAQLATAIRAMPEALRTYKSLYRFSDAVLGWLDTIRQDSV